MLVAHRGGAALAPENTLVAFRSAVTEWRADMLELDVRLTRDGHVVVIHDATLDRTTDGSGPVADRRLDEIQALDAGYRFRDPEGRAPFEGRGARVPTLAEVLVACPYVRINAEVKEARVAGPCRDVIEAHGAWDRVLVAADREEWRDGARGYRGPWGASRRQLHAFWLSHRLPGGGPYTPGADVLQVPEAWDGRRIVTPRFVREAHRRNLPVHVWTVDDVDDMRRLLAWGVDGIQTDRPDLLATVLREVAGRPPPPGLAGAGGVR
jgi:glycerophosphoryl diester phosphodiesterase